MAEITAGTLAEQLIELERRALERWGNGDPDGFLDLYAPEVTYFDPLTERRIDGHAAMADYYRPWIGKIQIARFAMLNPHVVVDGNMAVLTYNLVNYNRDANGTESIGNRWNSTTVLRKIADRWKTVHSHWSFTSHPAFHGLTVESSEATTG